MYEIKITVNDEEIQLTEFPGRIITNVLIGILTSLRGVDQVGTAKIELAEIKS